METTTLQQPQGASPEITDSLFNTKASKIVMREGKQFINPFGVLLGKNLSGQQRGEDVLHDKAFMKTTERFGIIAPVFVRLVNHDGEKRYAVVAGNRRTYALRHLLASGQIPEGDRRSFMPIYEMNEIELRNVSPENAANLLENAMRKRLDHMAKARAIEELVSGGATKEELSLLITGPNGRPLSSESIRQYRQLLKLHPSVQKAISDGIMAVNRANSLIELTHAEQMEALERIREAQGVAKNKDQAVVEVVKHMKAQKRISEGGEPIFEEPRNAVVMRRAIKECSKVEGWDCVPKSSKLNNEGYAVLAEIFTDLHLWASGGLTPRKYKPEDITLTLKTRILATMAKITPRGT